MARAKATFGGIRRLPSGRYQARYSGPDLVRHTAPITFDTKGDAETWLAMRRTEIARGVWMPPHSANRPLTFGEYADKWLADRDLKPRTRAHYRSLLDARIIPTFGPLALRYITPTTVRTWYADGGRGDVAAPAGRTWG